MDFRINKTDFHRQIGAVHHTKRVRKPNKDEAEQDGERFSDHLDLVSLEEDQGDEEKGSRGQQTGEKTAQGKPQDDDEESSQLQKPLGRHIDIKI